MKGTLIFPFVFTLLLLLCENTRCDQETTNVVGVVDENKKIIVASRGKDVASNRVEEKSRFFINGYPKYAIWRTFDAIEVTLKDEEGSVKANQCVLRVGKEIVVDEEEEEEEEIRGGRKAPSDKFENSETKSWQYRRVKMKREKKNKVSGSGSIKGSSGSSRSS